jgi:SAM-dependent methyltransferase
MSGFYRTAYNRLPLFLKRRIDPLRFAIEDFICSARPLAGAWVLDAGSGESQLRDVFASCRYVALDSCVGEPGWDYSGVNVVGDLHSLPLAGNSFDMVVNIQVLEHVENPVQALGEFQRILRPGGMLLLTAPQGWHEHQQPHDYFRFTRFSLTHMLRQAHFERFQVEPLGGYFHYLGQRLTYIPKVLFAPLGGWKRIVLFPLEVTSLVLFCGFLPLLCYYLDRFDGVREFTLGYKVKAFK